VQVAISGINIYECCATHCNIWFNNGKQV